MKVVRQKVFDKYSSHDLNHKKEFIKSTVKEVGDGVNKRNHFSL